MFFGLPRICEYRPGRFPSYALVSPVAAPLPNTSSLSLIQHARGVDWRIEGQNDRHTSDLFSHTGKLDFSIEDSIAKRALLGDTVFPDWQDDTRRGDAVESPDEMQRKDPLATQIWKLYSRTKSQLPNQERMENLTWRMMAMSLRRQERERAEQAR